MRKYIPILSNEYLLRLFRYLPPYKWYLIGAAAAMVAGGDLMYVANNWATNGNASYGPAYIICGVLYFCLCFPLSTWARRHEERLKRQDSRKAAPAAGKGAA